MVRTLGDRLGLRKVTARMGRTHPTMGERKREVKWLATAV
jgi:hypothetical protein